MPRGRDKKKQIQKLPNHTHTKFHSEPLMANVILVEMGQCGNQLGYSLLDAAYDHVVCNSGNNSGTSSSGSKHNEATDRQSFGGCECDELTRSFSEQHFRYDSRGRRYVLTHSSTHNIFWYSGTPPGSHELCALTRSPKPWTTATRRPPPDRGRREQNSTGASTPRALVTAKIWNFYHHLLSFNH